MDNKIYYEIFNLKKLDYKTMLTLTSLIELLESKNIISKDELIKKIKNLDDMATQNSGI